jgi:hypothetical protein
MKRLFYGPPNWIITKFSAEDRRTFGFWVIIFAIVGSIFFGSSVLWVTILSVIALIPNFTTETPMEAEKDRT